MDKEFSPKEISAYIDDAVGRITKYGYDTEIPNIGMRLRPLDPLRIPEVVVLVSVFAGAEIVAGASVVAAVGAAIGVAVFVAVIVPIFVFVDGAPLESASNSTSVLADKEALESVRTISMALSFASDLALFVQDLETRYYHGKPVHSVA